MLRELKIENLAIIDELDLEFGDGLIVLTGETGAGKSIILSGINLLIGEKASVDMIRDGEDHLLAQGVFEINEEQAEELSARFGIDVEDNEVIVRRYFDRNSRGKVYVNGVRVSLTNLKEIMGTLVDIVGQHSHQMLLNKNNHVRLLDKFLGEEGKGLRGNINRVYLKCKEVSNRIDEIEKNRQEAIEKREFYEFQLNEINRVAPEVDEDNRLEEEYKKLFNAGKIKDKILDSNIQLRDGEINALHFINNSRRNIELLCKYGEEFEEILEKLEKVYYELEDCIDMLDTADRDIDIDENRLQKVIERLDLINKMKSKYGATIEEIIEFRDSIAEKINLLEENSFEVKKLLKEKKEAEEEYWKLALELRELRLKKALEIEKLLEQELQFLKMGDARFHIVVDKNEHMGNNGSDSIEFLISTNIGQGMKPLWKIASGGEVSRIMLALKVIFSRVDNIPILIFDEIDTGVGGETVRKIADKLREIGDHAQVVSITHSPAIAARAHEQFYIKKETVNNKTSTTVKKLDAKGRVVEIARMLAGENVTEAVLKHAEELLNER
ncbi:DNA repair protein RecN [uncultured Fusobacterium sp.]|jgi:DNA repair protein RecN (Recombination protein N)|uniref:DNA repair protein RecN n=1 Tax=uncultured Fusobacterium sp. TaxID=159267 RepID=UPI0025FA53D9|nr:DNA repair protein RecN [uncultured Fusobacterium sp.]